MQNHELRLSEEISFPDAPSLEEASIAIVEFDNEPSDYERHYTYSIEDLAVDVDAASCNPPTPVSTLDDYRNRAHSYRSDFSSIISSIGPNDLHMDRFAKKLNLYVNFLRGIPTFCIGESNRAAFEGAQSAISRTSSKAESGVRRYEINMDSFERGARQQFQVLTRASDAINSASRDFRPVLTALQDVQKYVQSYNISIWNISNKIRNANGRIAADQQKANAALGRAVDQIETNVSVEAERFEAARRRGEAAQRHWETEDGRAGFERFAKIFVEVRQNLLPDFNALLSRVPRTGRTETAIANAQQSLNAIVAQAQTFPTYPRLPGASSQSPYNEYGKSERKYGQPVIQAIVKKCCVGYKAETSNVLYVGDISYAHGGRAKPHKSHREGYDADVDPVEVGNVGEANFNAGQALVAAKVFLQSGADIIFYGHQATVDAANEWAKENKLSARLMFESDHKRHFHLRKNK